MSKSHEEQTNQEIIYGKHAVLEALSGDSSINKFYLQNGLNKNRINDILNMVNKRHIVISEVPKTKLDELTSNGNHQGVAVSVPPVAYQTLDDCFTLAKERGEEPFFLILDGIEDPHNLGSIIRTADAVGVHGISIPKRRAVGLTNIVAKTSTGAIEHVPVVRVTNLSQTMDQLKEKGLWIFATAMDGEDMRDWNSQGPIALIIGNEGQGVSEKLLKNADGTVTIPMVGHVQSLNASVATAVLAYEVARHRIPK